MSHAAHTKKTPITVLKVGGARLASRSDLDKLADELATIRRRGSRVVVVHGGGLEINELQQRLDIPYEKLDGLRVTSDAGMSATIMVLCGLVRTRLVGHLMARGLNCLGVSGVDLGLLRAPFVDESTYGRVGGPPVVDHERLGALMFDLDVLVVSPVSTGPDGRAVNVNADDAAHAIAIALDARSLDFVSDIPGVRTGSDEVARELFPELIASLIADGVVRGGMVPKLKAAVAAVDSGVDRVRIGSLSTMARGRATVIRAAAR